jgi:protoporphyrinogen/coproporphyrinogen III oxidase
MKRIAIIGGGISGLSAAFALEQRRREGTALRYALYESSPRLGGAIRTECVDDCLVEAGPDSFLTEKSTAADLCCQLGIGNQLIGSNDAGRKTYILLKGRLVPIPDGLVFMVPTKILPILRSPLFSASAKLRMAREWFYKPQDARKQDSTDETVASFIDRHYGKEMVDRLVNPLLAGVYGGLASQLSIRAVLPRFVEIERKHGSLSRGMISRTGASTHASAAQQSIFTTLRNGMQSLTDALTGALDLAAVRLNTPVQEVHPSTDGWTVSSTKAAESFEAVILSAPAHAAASVLQAASPQLSSELASIPYSSSVTVVLGFDENVRRPLPPGFGFLVPRSEGRRLIAATFVHNKFPYRAPDRGALIRCFLGGAADEQALELTDNQILEITRTELGQILGITAEPLFTRVYKWKSAMAQYTVGHLQRIDRIENLRRQLPGLGLAGNAYRGIGIPDCINSGIEAAGAVLQVGVNPAQLQSHPLF